MTIQRSMHRCPCCGSGLFIDTLPNENLHILIYCGHGPCRCLDMNEGARGKTEEEAFAALEQLYDKTGETDEK